MDPVEPDPLDVVAASRRLSAALRPGDLEETLGRITAAAVEVLPDVDCASITIRHADGRLETAAPTDDVLLEIDAAQYELGEGPCYESAVEAQHVTAPNLEADSRYKRYAPVAVAAGIHAQAGVRLFEVRGSHGALNLYSRRVGAFQDLGPLELLFTHHAATALDYARHIGNLNAAIETRQRVGQAVGIIMANYQLDEARAFAFLTRLAAESETKVRVIAERLIEHTNADG